MAEITAIAWASGLIEFVAPDAIPDGACAICTGADHRVKDLIVATARHGMGRSEGKFLVPGVPEAEDQVKAMDALIAYTEWVKRSRRRGTRIRFGRP